MNQYKCLSCKKEYSLEEFKASDNGLCPICGSLLYQYEEAFVESLSAPHPYGDCTLGIYVLDFSESMDERAFSEDKYNEYEQRKIDLVFGAICGSLPRLRCVNNAQAVYIALIGFAKNAKLLGLKKASEIEDAEYLKKWLIEKREAMLEHGKGKNISVALRLAREIYDSALNGKMNQYGLKLKDFSGLMQEGIIVGDTTVLASKLRVFLYTDGDHYASEEFKNYFEGATIINGKSNINGLITAYFGNVNTDGYKRLEDISGVCPIHNAKGILHINDPEYYKYLRSMVITTIGYSGFCKCCFEEYIIRKL